MSILERALRPIVILILASSLSCVSTPASAATRNKTKKETKLSKTRDYAKTLATLKTSQGDIVIRFYHDKAPNHVKNFVDLAARGFYDGTLFHRVIPEFMIQAGDPITKDSKKAPILYGTGNNVGKDGKDILVKAEFNDVSHKRGIVSMARATDPNSASSQFFIVVKDSAFLDRQYTVFGEVVKGMESVDKIVSESRPDLADRSGGRPTVYQKLLKVDLSEEAPSGQAGK